MARVYIGGPSGSGKTAACGLVAQELGISSLTGSQIMMQAAGISTRSELENLLEETKQDLRLHAFEDYYKMTPNLVIDGHFYLTEIDIRYFDAYVLVDIDTPRLIEFRMADGARERSLDPLDIAKETQELHQRVEKLESDFGIRVIRVKNEGTLEELSRSVEGAYISACPLETRVELLNRGKERR